MSESLGSSDAVREALLEQLSHLAEEIEAFANQLDSVPADVLDFRPVEGELSLKEMYALISAYDRHVYLPAVESLERGEPVELNTPTDASLLEEEVREEPTMGALLGRVSSARSELVELLKDVRDWSLGIRIEGQAGNVYDLAYAIIQHDAGVLRSAALRMHDLLR